MPTASLKQFVAAALHALRRSRARAWTLLPGMWFVELRCVRRIDALSRRLVGMQAKIGRLSGHLLAGRMAGAVDADRSLRRMLAELKDDLGAIRRDLAQWHVKECRGRTGVRLEAAITRLNRVAADTYAAADRLEWDLGEHERRYGC